MNNSILKLNLRNSSSPSSPSTTITTIGLSCLLCRKLNLSRIIWRRQFSQSAKNRRLDHRIKQKCNYDVLGVKPGASSAEIKSAYYEKSKKYHPDRNKEPGSEQKFQEVNNAYEVLSNEESRANYDASRGFGVTSQTAGFKYEPRMTQRE